MKKYAVVLMLCTSFGAVSAYAEKVQINMNIDSVLKQCAANAQTTMDSSECYIQATQSWDAELNKQYKLLIDEQPETSRTPLKESQRAWIKYKESYFKAIDAFYQKEQGTVWSIIAAESKMNVIRDKAIDLNRLLNSTDLS